MAQTIILPVFADFDGDRTVTLNDYPGMLQCWLGPGLEVDPSCVIGDSDSDQDIDLGDLAELQRRFDALDP